MFEMNPESLQKALLSALTSLLKSPMSREITVADRDGYSEGSAAFKVGIGNGEAFDILDRKEEERVLSRIENEGWFANLDLVFHIHYSISDGRVHKVHRDEYIVRMVFQQQSVEVLVHHAKGVRRIESDELVKILVKALNSELSRLRFSAVEIAAITST